MWGFYSHWPGRHSIFPPKGEVMPMGFGFYCRLNQFLAAFPIEPVEREDERVMLTCDG